MFFLIAIAAAEPPAVAAPYDWTAAALASSVGYERLEHLCDDVGARPAGSVAYAAAVTLTEAWLTADGHRVTLDPVMENVWIRGEQKLVMTAPRTRTMAVAALGGSIGTKGTEAPVVVIREWAELGPQVKGKIVLFNHPMAVGVPAIEHYGDAVQFRGGGASKAAAFGAVAALVRSVTTHSLYTLHTGAMHYDHAQPRIPSAAITVEDAEQIARLAARGIEVKLKLTLGAADAKDAPSHNVVADLVGREKPEEIVLLGAHLDSWDAGQGAQDDGAGVAEVVEALRLIRARGQARRTIRVVLYANEEHGLSGGKSYALQRGKEHHIAAIEADLGAGAPVAWEMTGTAEQRVWFEGLAAPLGLRVGGEGGGADISTLDGVPQIGLLPDDAHYFDIHHTEADTFDKVDKEAMQRATAAIAALAWAIADAP